MRVPFNVAIALNLQKFELLTETRIWIGSGPLGLDQCKGIPEADVVFAHQVCYDYCGRSGDTGGAVDQDATSLSALFNIC